MTTQEIKNSPLLVVTENIILKAMKEGKKIDFKDALTQAMRHIQGIAIESATNQEIKNKMCERVYNKMNA